MLAFIIRDYLKIYKKVLAAKTKIGARTFSVSYTHLTLPTTPYV